MAATPTVKGEGSSPLTRGKPRGHWPQSAVGGLIPAHAGKTLYHTGRGPSLWAHPRSRGENIDGVLPISEYTGSSPLTRGKLDEFLAVFDPDGLIPAHAGKTYLATFSAVWGPAHPRSRGENHTGSTRNRDLRGSSPLTRGKRSGPGRSLTSCGLIPAHAGKTSRAFGGYAYMGAHPRSRGENLGQRCAACTNGGSSPLTRGKLYRFDPSACGRRLIPAHAGKTRARQGLGPAGPAHPRSRGENKLGRVSVSVQSGSSPLTRGKPVLAAALAAGVGLIPAHAGKTS